ncbi:MAG: tRNA nucleotidyltransferase [Candidatus Alkanophagales archaeon MCA70_species_2]|nr:tRNA nucleotidyltransferase [Candidatus Alkanophaga liquidiphilum]
MAGGEEKRGKGEGQAAGNELKRVLDAALSRIKPSNAEKERLKKITDFLVNEVNKEAEKREIPAKGILVGSVARDTWLSGQRDVDVFVMLPEDFSDDALERVGMELARGVAEHVAERYEERYASHPYVHAWVRYERVFHAEEWGDGGRRSDVYEVDIVPCFSVSSAAAMRSAVDRTPFHNEYVKRRIFGLEDEVRLLKQFLKGLEIYGAEHKTQGFSGYLCELLIIRYGSFLALLEAAAHWKFRTLIDIEQHRSYEIKGDEPLIVIDPVDPHRNVAAAVSVNSFAKFVDAARSFLENPSLGFFFPPEQPEMSKKEFLELIKKRGTDVIIVVFDVPDVVDDVLFPQLRKALASVSKLIERNGFRIFRRETSAEGGKAFFLFEMEVSELPPVKRHLGPPVTAEPHAQRFKKKHAGTQIYIENGRYVVEIPRKYVNVVDLLRRELRACALGKHVAKAVARGYEVMRNEEIEFFEGLGKFLSKYFSSSVKC